MSLHTLNVAPGSAIESAHIAATDAGNLMLMGDSTLTGVKLYVNGTQYSAGVFVPIVVDDLIWYTGTAPATYNSPAFVNLLVEGVSFASYVVLTEQDPAYAVLDPAYIDRPLDEYLTGYSPVTQANQIVMVTTSNDSANVIPIAAQTTPVGGTVGDEQPYLFVSDYVNNLVHRISPISGQVVQSISVNKPHGLGYTPMYAYEENVIANTIVSSPFDNSVYVYSGNDHTLLKTALTGAGPYGVCGELTSTVDDYGFWVACFDADRVEHWQYTNSTDSLVRDYYYDLPANSGPYDIKTDENNDAYVSLLISDKVAKLPTGGGGTITYVTVGTDPWELIVEGYYVYVACAGSNEVHAIEKTSFNSSTPISVQLNPTSLYVANDKLYVGSFQTGNFQSYNFTSATSLSLANDITESHRLFEGMIANSAGSYVFGVNMYNDAPDHMVLPDNTPDNVTFVPQTDIDKSVVVNSNQIIISGVTTATNLWTVPTSSSPVSPYIEKNNSNVGQSTTMVNGDTVEIVLTSPSDSIPTVSIPLVYDGGMTLFTFTMTTSGVKVRIAGWIQGG